MAKGTAKIQGEKFEQLWRGKKSRAKIAAELKASASSITGWSRPGVHGVNIEQFETWPEDVRNAVAINGHPATPPDANDIAEPLTAEQIKELADELLTLAAKKRGEQGGKKRR
jgi:hypothetical protein